MNESVKLKEPWVRYRFVTDAEDYRPIILNPAYPWWCSGFNILEEAIIIVFLPKTENLKDYWPEAENITEQEVNEIVFTDRFSKPDWFIEVPNE